MQDAVVNLIRVSLRDHQRFGHPPPRAGNQLGRTVPGTTYPCAPGGSERLRLYLRAAADVETVSGGNRPAGTGERSAIRDRPEARWENRAALNAIIEDWTRQRTKHEVMAMLGEAGVPSGACQDTGEVLADPQLRAREMIVDVDFPTRGTYQTVGCPIKLSDSPAEITRPPLAGRTYRRGAGCAV